MPLLNLAQIIIAILLIISILLQNRGAGLSGVFGGSGNVYAAKRGLEKKLFYATIVLATLFFVVSFVIVIF
jgi:protein translocase SecG subunit